MTVSEYNPVQTSELTLHEKVYRYLWSFVNMTIYRWSPFFARGFRNFCVRSFVKLVKTRKNGGGGQISTYASFARLARIDCPWNLSIGNLSSVGNNVWVYALDQITIGEKCCIGEYVKLLTGSHNIGDRRFRLVRKPITIGDCVWIATGATVLPGVTIGDGAVVAAESVVAKDVEPWTVVGGNPAKVIRKREFEPEK